MSKRVVFLNKAKNLLLRQKYLYCELSEHNWIGSEAGADKPGGNSGVSRWPLMGRLWAGHWATSKLILRS